MNDIAARIYRNVGGSMFLFGALFLWLGIGGILGILLVLIGGGVFLGQLIVEGTHKLIESASNPVEDWQGELLHTEGGKFKVRYSFDANNQPRFVAGDVCRAIGVRTPSKGALKLGGAALLMQGEHACFSEAAVQTFLTPLAINNHEANLLLNKLRNEVFRKLEKQRELENNASKGSVI